MLAASLDVVGLICCLVSDGGQQAGTAHKGIVLLADFQAYCQSALKIVSGCSCILWVSLCLCKP